MARFQFSYRFDLLNRWIGIQALIPGEEAVVNLATKALFVHDVADANQFSRLQILNIDENRKGMLLSAVA